MTESNKDPKSTFNTVIVVMVSQVGCLTLVIILASLFAGLWLDRTFDTKPLFTLILMLAGIPLSVVLMLTLARKSIAKIESGNSKTKQKDISE
jgi:F0F1-type ATP synthase assembly protein I